MSSPELDEDIFCRRLKRVYNFWNNSNDDSPLGQLNSIVIPYGIEEDVANTKSKSLVYWLFLFDLTGIVIIFTKEELHILGNKEKIEFLRSTEHLKENQDLPRIKLTVRDETDKDEANYDALIEVIKKEGRKYGVFANDSFKNDFIVDFQKKLDQLNYEQIDVSASFAYIMAVKEENRIESVKKLYYLIVKIYNRFKNYCSSIIQTILGQIKGNPKLKDLCMKPNLHSNLIRGTLESNVNGFCFTSIRGDKVDVLYNNIKHAFYESCDEEMIILIHFNLKNAIMVGEKKLINVQFYADVGQISAALNKNQNLHDRSDLSAEQAENELREKLKSAFRSFCDKVKQVKPDFDFEIPIRELGFNGIPYKNSVFLQPTSRCLVHLIEWPPFVIALDEIERVIFERVNCYLKSFDIVFIFKDYHRKVSIVNEVPYSSLDSIKSWLTQSKIKCTEQPINLNWKKIMKVIVDDPTQFFETGGWSFLDTESDLEDNEDDMDWEEENSTDSQSDLEDYEDETNSEEESGRDSSEPEEEDRA